MPDFFGYTDPFNKAGQAMGPQRVAPPANAARPRSLFEDPALQQMLAKMPGRSFGDVGPTTALPGEMQPLAGQNEGPFGKALGSEGGGVPYSGTIDSEGILKQARDFAIPSPGPATPAGAVGGFAASPAVRPAPPMQMLGGAAPAPASLGTADYMKQLNDVMSQPVSLGQEFVAPHKWSVGPARRMGETDVQAGQREEADYQGRLGAAQQAQQAQQFGTTAALSSKAQQMQTLNELLRGQNEQAFRDKQLGLDERKVKLAESEAGPVGIGRRQYIEKRARQEAGLQARGILAGTPAFATSMKQWEDANPEPMDIAPAAGPGTVGASGGPLPPVAPAGPGGKAPAPSTGKPSPADLTNQNRTGFLKGIPTDLQAMMNKDAGESKQTPLEEFMTKLYQGAQTHPEYNTPGTMDKIIAEMENQYGKDKVASALSTKSLAGVDAEMLSSAMSRMNPFTSQTEDEEGQAKFKAKAAIRNQMAGNPPGGVPANQRPQSKAGEDINYLFNLIPAGAKSLYGGLRDYAGAVGSKERMDKYLAQPPGDWEKGIEELGRRLGLR